MILDKTVSIFEERYDCEVEVELVDKAGDLITRLIEEKDDPQADIVIGINNGNFIWAMEHNLVQAYKAKEIDTIEEAYHFDLSYHFTPFNYAYYAILYDTYLVNNPPETFGKMQDGLWKNHLLISDARYSANGLGFLLWSVSMFGERGYGHFWRSIKNNVFFISSTWEQSFNMFLAGEAPFLLAYTTTPTYFIETENNYRYKTFIPHEGAYMFIEGVGIVEGSDNVPLAKEFIDFVISRDFQNHIAPTLWMYPVVDKAVVPPSFKDIMVPENVLNSNIRSNLRVSRINTWINQWTQIMVD